MLKINEEDVNKKIYYLDNTNFTDPQTNENHYHDKLNEINELNTKLYVYFDEISEIKFGKYIIPKKEGLYSLKLELNIKMENCSYMFFDCKNIIHIDLSSFDTTNITNMSKMFYKCTNLKYIDFTYFSTKNVIDMSDMFNCCFSLDNIDLSYFDTQNVIDMSNMFYACKNLRKADFSGFDTKKVTNMS